MNMSSLIVIWVIGISLFGCVSTGSSGNMQKEGEPHLSLQLDHFLVPIEGEGTELCYWGKWENQESYEAICSSINNFSLEWGNRYSLLVKTKSVKKPPADGSNVVYELVEIQKEEPIDLATEFKILLKEEMGSLFLSRLTDSSYSYLGSIDLHVPAELVDELEKLISGEEAVLAQVQYSSDRKSLILKSVS